MQKLDQLRKVSRARLSTSLITTATMARNPETAVTTGVMTVRSRTGSPQKVFVAFRAAGRATVISTKAPNLCGPQRTYSGLQASYMLPRSSSILVPSTWRSSICKERQSHCILTVGDMFPSSSSGKRVLVFGLPLWWFLPLTAQNGVDTSAKEDPTRAPTRRRATEYALMVAGLYYHSTLMFEKKGQKTGDA